MSLVAQLIQEAPNNSLWRDILRCIGTNAQCELVEISDKFRT